MLLLVHKCLRGNAPVSLANMLSYNSSTRTCKLNQLRSNRLHGVRAFSRSGPKLWNLLPFDIRMEKDCNKFKVLVKTYLFKESRNYFAKINEH